jgi:hypothetical protein
MKKTIIAIGLRAKTARAIAVILSGPATDPAPVRRVELIFATAKTPATFQPYHEVMAEPWERAQLLANKSEVLLVATAAKALQKLVQEAKNDEVRVGIVGAADKKLETIASPHIRAHAAEGVLFRRILELACEENKLKWRTFAEKDLQNQAIEKLGVSEYAISQKLAQFGQALGRPWRADEKAAATGAWLALN